MSAAWRGFDEKLLEQFKNDAGRRERAVKPPPARKGTKLVRKSIAKPSALRAENLLANQIEREGLPTPTLEYRFHPTRKWRTDLAWPELKILLEIDGGIWISGRHNHPSGFMKDMEKMNAAALMGFRVFRTTPQEVKNGKALQLVKQALAEG